MITPASPVSTSLALVVGTTPDYVDWIRRARPGRALFLTDEGLRRSASEPSPDPSEEITLSLDETPDFLEETVRRHLKLHEASLAGIACFDCERMSLASELAARFGLPYPSAEAIRRCRDKSLTKFAWTASGVACPRFAVPCSEEDSAQIATDWSSPLVLKPRTGSGSELVFRCDDPEETRETFRHAAGMLEARTATPMYQGSAEGDPGILAEECVLGTECSCDFLLHSHEATLVRISAKHPLDGGPFGTTAAYELIDPSRLPFDSATFCEKLVRAAESLGIEEAWCMADFIVRDGECVFLEMAPRPGGDCLPWLLRSASGRDILLDLLDFAEGRLPRLDDPPARGVGLRLFANREGTLRHVETGRLADDPRVLEVYLRRRDGDKVLLPPRDYDTWILGHAVYFPEPDHPIACQNEELTRLLKVEWE